MPVVQVRSSAPNGAAVRTSVMVGGEQRRVQRGDLTCLDGSSVSFALPEPVVLRMGDVLELDDGTFVDVVVEPEPLAEIRGNDLTHLARLAWHLGDRHVPVQVLANRLRMRRDAALETMLLALGARVTPIEAPFDPEGGAYAARVAHDHAHCGHDHSHDHHHGHDRHDHDHHGHGHGHHHD